MAGNMIEVRRKATSPQVYKGTAIGEHEFFIEFDVTVATTGCYAIHIALVDRNPILSNKQLGSINDAELDCFCLTADSRKTFFSTGAGPPPKGSRLTRSDGQRLPGLTGSWPNSDGPFDDRLNDIFAVIRVFRCSIGACETDAQCELGISARRLTDVVASRTWPMAEADVANGTGTEEGIELLWSVAKGAASAGMARADMDDTARDPIGAVDRKIAIALAMLRRRLQPDRLPSEAVESASDEA